MGILEKDKADLEKRTKLSLTDIHKLIELCVGINYFLLSNEIRIIENSGPIGLALMVVLSEKFLQHLGERSLQVALVQRVAPNTFKRYVDDSHSNFKNSNHPDEFLKILNSQNRAIQYTMERENDKKELSFLDVKISNSFLDVKISNTGDGKYAFDVFRKEAITNVQVKPTSAINPSIPTGIFKSFLHRARKMCSEENVENGIQFLL